MIFISTTLVPASIYSDFINLTILLIGGLQICPKAYAANTEMTAAPEKRLANQSFAKTSILTIWTNYIKYSELKNMSNNL